MRPRRIIIVGCVKQKHQDKAARPLRELYTSQLWAGRRGYAEASGCDWRILSAFYGLRHPDHVAHTYDVRLEDVPARRVPVMRAVARERLRRDFGMLDGWVVEVHAGAAYVALIAPVIAQLRGSIDLPLAHLGQGQQLAWYKRHLLDTEQRAG